MKEPNSCKEYYVGCIATDITMCFILKDIGTNIAKDNGDSPYFLSSNENHWLAEAKEDIKQAKTARLADPKWHESFMKDVIPQVGRAKKALSDAAEQGLVNRSKWGKVLKDFSKLVQEIMEYDGQAL